MSKKIWNNFSHIILPKISILKSQNNAD